MKLPRKTLEVAADFTRVAVVGAPTCAATVLVFAACAVGAWLARSLFERARLCKVHAFFARGLLKTLAALAGGCARQIEAFLAVRLICACQRVLLVVVRQDLGWVGGWVD